VQKCSAGSRSSRTSPVSRSSPLRAGQGLGPRAFRPIRQHVRADNPALGAHRPLIQVQEHACGARRQYPETCRAGRGGSGPRWARSGGSTDVGTESIQHLTASILGQRSIAAVFQHPKRYFAIQRFFKFGLVQVPSLTVPTKSFSADIVQIAQAHDLKQRLFGSKNFLNSSRDHKAMSFVIDASQPTGL
jgi:hypothetical protein